MYLKIIKLWNFRRYGINGEKFETAKPGLEVQFNDGVNVLVGENDSGKTAIIDAIRYVLKTQSLEYIQLDDKDFFKEKSPGAKRTEELKIECTFSGFDDAEAGHFLEWIGFNKDEEYKLKVWLYAKRKDNRIYPTFRAGMDQDGSYMEGEARNLLRVIYLKPLRDALTEMTNGNRSRLAQILKSLEIFGNHKDDTGNRIPHELEEEYQKYQKNVEQYFDENEKGGKVKKDIVDFLTKDFLFKDEERKPTISIEDSELTDILKDLNLILEDNKSGLGSLNLLCIAAELLHLKEKKAGLKLTLIEELEAHLHPQYQLRVIDFIQRKKKEYGQCILTTHSTTLASKIDLESLIICRKEGGVFSMGHEHTQLEEGDYLFLKRFLDATKANLFFARGVIIVEGDAENLLLPTIAEIIDRPLHHYGVSIVNVGSTAFKRYAKIFLRKKDAQKEEWLGIHVAIISDLDVRSIEYYNEENERKNIWIIDEDNISQFKGITTEVDWENVKNIPSFSETALKDLIKSNKTVERFSDGKIMEKIEKEIEQCKKEITEEMIKSIRECRTKSIKERNNDQNNKIFISPQWTLEYELACSCLAPYLEQATDMAKELKNNEQKNFGKNELKEIVESIKKDKEINSYDLFKPLNEGKISKAVTAQCLAELLSHSNKDDLKSKIVEDEKLKYICDAIYYVTEPKGGDE